MSEADAAAVASKLLDFYREPARFRPRYVNGQDTMPGTWVFKFAQARFPHGILRALDLEERGRLREAACAFIRQVCLREAATHYDVLGVHPAAKPEAVKENYHLLMALLHPDRRDAETWPTGSAQRVNQAYAVLSDERSRRAYEASVHKLGNGAARAAAAQADAASPPRVVHVPSGRRRRRSAMRAAIVVSAVIAALLFVQIAWVSDLPAEYRLLERAYPLELSTRWMRSVFSSSEAPRFLSDNAFTPRTPDAADETPPARLPRQRPTSRPETVMEAATMAPLEPLKPPAPAKRLAEAPGPAAAPARGLRLAADTADTADTAAPAQPQAAPAAITSTDIETLVARLVGSYEAGDVEGLMALLDRSEAASVRGARMRQLYDEFFRATRQRRLHVNTLAWQLGAASAQARGEAALSAQYVDQPGALERRIPLEVDIALREGRARITRLALFPDGI